MSTRGKQTLYAEVKSVHPKRLIVWCEGEFEAILPYWESAWTEEERKEFFCNICPGEPLDVVEIPNEAQPDSRCPDRIVSLKRVLLDFGELEISHNEKVLTIHVNRVTPRRAYGTVQLDVLVEGRQRPIEIPGFFNFKDLDNYIEKVDKDRRWKKHSQIVTGDILFGFCKNIDRNREEIEMNITRYLETIDNNLSLISHGNGNSLEIEIKAMDNMCEVNVYPDANASSIMISRIAVIDNDSDVLDDFVRKLKHYGYIVDGFISSQEFRLSSRRKPSDYEVVFVDVNLHGENDHDGLILAQEIQQENVYIKIVLITGECSINQVKIDKAPDLYICDYLKKPFFAEDIQDCLNKIATTQPFPLTDLLHEPPRLPSETSMRLDYESQQANTGKIKEVLTQLCKYCPGSTAVIFKMHTNTLACKLKNREGSMPYIERYLSMLKFSPVRDCIIEGEQIWADEVQVSESSQQKKHKWLLRFWGQDPAYQSCFGIKLSHQRDGEGYALFWFHPNKAAFDKGSVLYAQMAARFLDASYMFWGMRAELERERKLSLGGRVMQMTGHELASPLSKIGAAVNNYLSDLSRSSRHQTPLPEFPDIVMINLRKASKIANEFRYYVKGGGTEELSLNKTLAKSCRSVQELYPTINIYTSQWPDVQYILKGNESALQHAIFNVLLNAAQQMELFYRHQGIIWISLDDGPPNWARLQIRDTGPGIHPRDFGSIFDEGFTTKRKGSGLGLGITRRLIENFKGCVNIKYSFLFVSSCFEIKLPYLRME